ncbi:MAG: MarR family transcriptional regulator [Acholeplasmatales bacterium]|nr:MarR family transcriptional regulator [Acholeplasmatales bacterium]
MEDYSCLKLKNQLCFPLYSVSNLIIRNYKPLLDKINLTYTQYITMMVLWEKDNINEKELCDSLFLKSNTITPLLKKLEEKGYILIHKASNDKRNIIISLTREGNKLKDKAKDIPNSISKSIGISMDEAKYLYGILYKILESNYEN